MAEKKGKKLAIEDLVEVVKNAPLVSIDLIIRNRQGQVLLGFRNNEPAKGFWFVPGGRILKNERIAEAFERIAKQELGIKLSHKKGKFMGAFEHLYKENFTCQGGFGTHYVVLAFEIKTAKTRFKPFDKQHSQYKWFDRKSLCRDKTVHHNTRAYFAKKKKSK